jgi:anthranilate/para-aminobenzoate synthase component II
MHGKASPVEHDGTGLFAGLDSPLTAMRYHSLVAAPESVPAILRVTARSADGVVMAVEHRSAALFGVQFHPESIGTPEGPRVLANFLALARAAR